MLNNSFLESVLNEIKAALDDGYLSEDQVEIFNDRKDKKTYDQIVEKHRLSCKTVLTHCLSRTSRLMFWKPAMPGRGEDYLSPFDRDIFFGIIGDAADDSNCVPAIYALSLAYYLKKRRNLRASYILNFIGCNKLAANLKDAEIPSRAWLNILVQDSEFKITSSQQIEIERRTFCDASTIYLYFLVHQGLFQRDRRLIINMDETMLSAKRRLKVLAREGKLPLVPEAVKVPHLTGCVAFTASGFVFDPMIILPRKKTLRTLQEFEGLAVFTGSFAGWMTKNLFTYYAIYLICQISHYRLTLPHEIRNERFLLLLDGHPSRNNFIAALILYLFEVDLVLLPPHTSHLLQAFDVAVAAPLKSNFKNELVHQQFNLYFANGYNINKQTARELRTSLIKSFLNSLRKSATISNIESGFSSSGIYPLNVNQPLSSQYTMLPKNNSIHLNQQEIKDYWLNNEEGLAQLFENENGRKITENDFQIDLKKIVKDIKNSTIEEGKGLSNLPPLFLEDGDTITEINLN